jgi:hypothetical protein
MPITRQMIAEKIAAYLHHQIELGDLVDWAEQQVMEGEFDSPEARDAAARIGLADVRSFGMSWEECERLLRTLGFSAHIDIVAA